MRHLLEMYFHFLKIRQTFLQVSLQALHLEQFSETRGIRVYIFINLIISKLILLTITGTLKARFL